MKNPVFFALLVLVHMSTASASEKTLKSREIITTSDSKGDCYDDDSEFQILKSGWKLKLGGYMRLDVIYASGSVYHLDSPAYVPSEDKGSNTGWSVRATRFHAKVIAPTFSGMKSFGYYEMDFYGNLPASSTSIRQPQPRMRRAFFQMEKGNFTFTAGNEWMVAAPAMASTLEPFNLWTSGNIWMRYPQLILRYNIPATDKFRIEMAASAGQPLGADNPTNTRFRQTGAGEAALFPIFQARTGAGFKIGNNAWSSVGISGSYQRLDFSAHNSLSSDATLVAELIANDEDIQESYFGAVDATVFFNIGKFKMKLSLEASYGKAIAPFNGGILENFYVDTTDTARITGVRSLGYFGDLKISTPWKFDLMGGLGRAENNPEDLLEENGSSKGKTSNTTAYGAFSYRKGPVLFALGFTWMKTSYLDNNFTEGTAYLIHGVTSFHF
ncbi:MAG: hypothetical protein JXR95_13415 [Deltaproteobacteria bacterium]|nr:hypothetical protein [Deltaproteobacteria bacterium]